MRIWAIIALIVMGLSFGSSTVSAESFTPPPPACSDQQVMKVWLADQIGGDPGQWSVLEIRFLPNPEPYKRLWMFNSQPGFRLLFGPEYGHGRLAVFVSEWNGFTDVQPHRPILVSWAQYDCPTPT